MGCTLALAGAAHAEALAGTAEMVAGAHVMLLPTQSCDQGGANTYCKSGSVFIGLETQGRVQLGHWFALGARAALSLELGDSFPAGLPSNPLHVVERDLWLWQFALQARFDPTSWPQGLWLAAELGAALAVDGFVEFGLADDVVYDTSLVTPALLLAAAVGYDFELGERFLLGFELRSQYLTLHSLPPPRPRVGERQLEPFPYISFGMRSGMRW